MTDSGVSYDEFPRRRYTHPHLHLFLFLFPILILILFIAFILFLTYHHLKQRNPTGHHPGILEIIPVQLETFTLRLHSQELGTKTPFKIMSSGDFVALFVILGTGYHIGGTDGIGNAHLTGGEP